MKNFTQLHDFMVYFSSSNTLIRSDNIYTIWYSVETEQEKEGITPYRVVPSHILQLLGLRCLEKESALCFFFFLLTTYPLFSDNYSEKAFAASFLSLVFFFFFFSIWSCCLASLWWFTGRRKLIIKNLLKLFLQLFGRRLICVFLSWLKDYLLTKLLWVSNDAICLSVWEGGFVEGKWFPNQ